MLTRGPLPSSIYWRRRLVLLSVAVVLVVVIAKVLDHGGSGGSGSTAVQMAQTSTNPSTSPNTSQSAPSQTTSAKTHHRRTPVTTSTAPHTTRAAPTSTAPTSTAPTTVAPAVPTGNCRADDVLLTPGVRNAAVGEPVTITLHVQTRTEPACYWQMSPSTLQVKIISHDTLVWSTADCHRAVVPQRLIVRSASATDVSLLWRGHTSDSSCSVHTAWAGEGTYSITATSLGGEPETSTFRMGAPTVVVTETPTPTDSPTPSDTPSGSPTP